MPGSFVTIERRVPVKRLKSVDLPTLGRPRITNDGSICVMLLRRRADNREPQQRCDLPLYRIQAVFAHSAALWRVSPIHRNAPNRRSVLAKRETPRQVWPGRFG